MEKKANGSENANSSILELLNEISLTEEVKLTKTSHREKIRNGFRSSNSTFSEFMQRNPLFSYSLKRILYAFITLYVAVAVVFVMLRLVTTDGVYLSDVNLDKLGPDFQYGTPGYQNLLNNRMKLFGVAGPMINQMFIYLRNITPFIPKTIIVNPIVQDNGDIAGTPTVMWFYLGVFMNKASGGQVLSLVQDAFKRSIPTSFKIGSIGVLLSYLIGVPLGILAAKNKEKSADNAINGSSLLISAIPALVVISLLYKMSIYVFGANGTYEGSSFGTKIWPIIGIMLLIMPMIIVNTRRFVLDEMTADYAKFALSKGLSEKYVFYVHIFRNAGIRLIKTLPEVFVLTLFGSSILVERHWSIDGMSKFILNGVANKDTFVVLGYIFVSASAGVFSSLIGDLLLATLDPRIKLTK
ncbi:oligopeptide ABC transporter permease OppB [Spiroplasma cantharicola]|uniref:Oligopeptide ABC transporter permease n=1 Tax=Spiroplasma cantharicola TaxID=362837 RepID=A0A0M4JX80_9MOLU|nr:oligopeptide ABC transporter permease OppB [Spiroplasma cantharicola]ALD66680.1 oligopeptide ABC transporter permease [Spiroplasma cantharicola]